MKKAFTLIEVLICVSIIAILVAIAVPNFQEVREKSKRQQIEKMTQWKVKTKDKEYISRTKPEPVKDCWIKIIDNETGEEKMVFASEIISFVQAERH